MIATSLKMANVWQKFVVLRMGKLQGVKGASMLAALLSDRKDADEQLKVEIGGKTPPAGRRTS